MDIFQALISIGTVIILYRAYTAQKKSNKNQKKIMKMDLLSKRSENLPIIELSLNKSGPDSLQDENGFFISVLTGEFNLKLKFKIIENSITNPRLIIETASDEFEKLPFQLDKDVFYSKDETKDLFNLITYNINDDSTLHFKTDDDPPDVKFTLYFNDLINNTYSKSVEFRFPDLISYSKMRFVE